MLRSLVGSEMCIRDRVSTQSTGTGVLWKMPSAMEEDEGPTLQFRNYRPSNTTLNTACLPTVVAPQLNKEILEMCLQQVQENEQTVKDGVLSIQPRKQNWDLKRDVQKKLDKLRKRTDRAVLELVREKLVKEGEQGGNLSRSVMSH
eukprot:TRINITY_DN14640_c0_g1_i3.p1 TRINITY_DN14640_c0_g1~~TRINITY_DN14640_c0_g1_i3.p1  ORF type:complete len:146 (-),score=34.60 TRINITY_DN14640_c0_g1_i3:454-891(-)